MAKFTATIFALLIAFGLYWFLIRDNAPVVVPSADNFYATSTDQTGKQGASEVSSGAQQGPSQQNQQATNPNNIMNATFHTNMGDFTVEFSKETPNTVANFVKLAQAGFYDGTKFHRVIAGFMSQGGDPLSKDDAMMARWGTGGPGYQFADEIKPTNRNAPGTISMANAGPNTNGSQFFVNAADNSFLDGKHTVFGRVVAGMDVVNKINAVETGSNDRPLSPVIIEKIELK